MEPTLHQLAIFASVARTGSFTRAAEELRLSQPVLSRAVRELERGLGVRLFDRTTRTVTATAAGAELRTHAEQILDGYRTGLRRFGGYLRGEHGTIAVAALPSIAATLLPPLLRDFHRTHPETRIRVLDGEHETVVDHIRSGAADFAVTERHAPDPDITATTLLNEPVVAVLPPDHRLAERERVTWRQLATEPFVAFSDDTTVRRLTDLAFAKAHTRPATVVEVRGVATAAGVIAAGLGVGAVPELVLPLMEFAHLTTRPVDGPRISRRLAVLVRTGHHLSPAARELTQRVRAMCTV